MPTFYHFFKLDKPGRVQISVCLGTACDLKGGGDILEELKSLLGIDVGESEKKVARVICQGGTDRCRVRFDYHGIMDCNAAAIIQDGYKACRFACLGLGNCERVCPFGAIRKEEG